MKEKLVWAGKISALVLTYNRKEILARCLKALLAQVEPPDEVVVLDNGSTDGTCEYLQEAGLLDDVRVVLFRFPENKGPAGGVDALFRLGKERASDWVWFLDDDIIADGDTLKELKSAFSQNFSRPEEVGYLKSVELGADRSPNNLPELDLRTVPGQSPKWADRLESGLVRTRWSTLNSILIPQSTLNSVGDMCTDFYFAGEDIDYTFRVTDVLPGYLVGRSKVTHLCALSGRFSSLIESDPKRISTGFYFYRNNLYFRWHYYSLGRTVLYVGKSLYEALLALSKKTYPLLRSATIIRGLLNGVVFIVRHRKTAARSLSSEQWARPLQISISSSQVGLVVPKAGNDISHMHPMKVAVG
jgi:dTDP-4-dehydrorhamnose reductase